MLFLSALFTSFHYPLLKIEIVSVPSFEKTTTKSDDASCCRGDKTWLLSIYIYTYYLSTFFAVGSCSTLLIVDHDSASFARESVFFPLLATGQICRCD